MSPRTKEQIVEIRAEKVEKISDTALRLFAKSGYDGTSISQIEAGKRVGGYIANC